MKKLLVFTFALIMLLNISVVFASEPDKRDALKFTKPPKIDGIISEEEWGPPTVAGITHGSPANATARHPEMGLTYDLWLGWDTDNLYVGVKVLDEALINHNTQASLWDGDALQMEIDPLGNWQSHGEDEYYYISDKTKEFAYGFNFESKESKGWCFTIGEEPEGDYAISNEDGYSYYEISLPWSYFEVEAPEDDSIIGFTIAILAASDYSYDNWLEYGSGCIMEDADRVKSGNNQIVLSKSTFTSEDVYPTIDITPRPTLEPLATETSDSNGGGKTNLLWYILIPVVLLALVVVAVIILKKKK